MDTTRTPTSRRLADGASSSAYITRCFARGIECRLHRQPSEWVCAIRNPELIGCGFAPRENSAASEWRCSSTHTHVRCAIESGCLGKALHCCPPALRELC